MEFRSMPYSNFPGHNWGSDHDPVGPNECNPPLDNGGKFLMYQSVNDGTLPNNFKFSVCSQAYVEPVVTAKSSRCFARTGMQQFNGMPLQIISSARVGELVFHCFRSFEHIIRNACNEWISLTELV